jgi:hypothetical protein
VTGTSGIGPGVCRLLTSLRIPCSAPVSLKSDGISTHTGTSSIGYTPSNKPPLCSIVSASTKVFHRYHVQDCALICRRILWFKQHLNVLAVNANRPFHFCSSGHVLVPLTGIIWEDDNFLLAFLGYLVSCDSLLPFTHSNSSPSRIICRHSLPQSAPIQHYAGPITHATSCCARCPPTFTIVLSFPPFYSVSIVINALGSALESPHLRLSVSVVLD